MREWHTVTVAFSASSSEATGLPTRSLRPTTTACAPSSGVSYRRSSSITPNGVADTRPSRPWTSRPAFVGVSPSTSFAGSTADVARAASRWPGSGSWTMIPLTAGSAFSSLTTASSSSWPASSGSSRPIEAMPTSAHARCLPAT